MSDGLKLISAIVENGSVSVLRDLPREIFVEDEVTAYQFVRTHYRRYGQLPALATIEEELSIELPEPDETIDYYIKKVYDRRTYTLIREQYAELQACLRAFDMDRAREVISVMRNSAQVRHIVSDIRNFRDASHRALELYDYAHENPGISGVPTGWMKYDTTIGGYQPADLVTYAARPGLGKTYTLLRHAVGAYNAGRSVLIVSMELAIEQITQRALGLMTGVDPNFIRRGTLSTATQRRLRTFVDNIRGADRLHVVSGAMSKTADSVDLLIQEFRPDIVMVDGMYLMGVSGKKFNNNSDRVSAVLDTLKESTLARNVPIIGTSQFNRIAGKKGKDGSLETVAYSDAISTHSSIVASIHEGLTGREAKTRRFELIKGREGESGTFYYRYEFRPVNLEEIDEDEEAGVIDADGNVLDWTV